MVVTMMQDVMTPAEKTLASTSKGDAVIQMRHLFQETMAADYTAAVERLTGLTVVAFTSGNQIDPDMAAELFVLDATV